MVIDGNIFIKRVHKFFTELQYNRFPNAQKLAKLCSCSKNTAQRVIYRLRDEYMVPMGYDPSERGYYLTDPNYSMPKILPPGRDELTALLLARDLVANIGSKDLITSLDNLWHQFITTNTSLSRELEPLIKVFSSDSTVVSEIADRGVIQYVNAASSGESVQITYKSPWRHTEEKIYKGQIERVHYSDGHLYICFNDSDGNQKIFNCSFIKKFEILPYKVEIDRSCSEKTDHLKPNNPNQNRVRSYNWLEGFGIWAGDALEEIEIHILPPAAKYYASQCWHDDQEDTWQDGVLIRKIKAIISPEIERRIMSIGKHIKTVKPDKLKESIRIQAGELARACGDA